MSSATLLGRGGVSPKLGGASGTFGGWTQLHDLKLVVSLASSSVPAGRAAGLAFAGELRLRHLEAEAGGVERVRSAPPWRQPP